LQPQCGGKLVLSDNIHLTLVFVGEVDQADIMRVIDAASTVNPEAFLLQLDQVGAFRDSKVVWLGPMLTPPPLSLLVNNLHNALSKAGFGFDNKPFVPHLTLLRKAGWLDRAMQYKSIAWPVKGYALVQSHSEPGGVRYEVLRRFAD
jgi:RNA 2',3'-cyclic 3'-phosphodiesterase